MLYRDAGVNMNEAEKAFSSIKSDIDKTRNDFVLTSPGYFGAAYKIPPGYKEPVLVSSIDGIGTKILVAIKVGNYHGLGEDIVNHCVNDILTMGAKPLYITDYYATGKLNNNIITSVIKGMCKACIENDCSLIGGETAEMPGIYDIELFDVAVNITGIVERDCIIDGSNIKAGDKVYGLESSGFHTNGYSLIRKIIFEKAKMSLDNYVEELKGNLGDILLIPHMSYYKKVFPIINKIKGIIHITGGGFTGNIPRVIPEGLTCYIDTDKWEIPAPFRFIQRVGAIEDKEMFNVFNMGIGMILIGKNLNVGFEIGEIQKGKEALILNGI